MEDFFLVANGSDDVSTIWIDGNMFFFHLEEVMNWMDDFFLNLQDFFHSRIFEDRGISYLMTRSLHGFMEMKWFLCANQVFSTQIHKMWFFCRVFGWLP